MIGHDNGDDKKKKAKQGQTILRNICHYITIKKLLIIISIQVVLSIFFIHELRYIKQNEIKDIKKDVHSDRFTFKYHEDYSETLILPKPSAVEASLKNNPMRLEFLEKYNSAFLVLTYVRSEYLTTSLKKINALPGINSMSKLYISQQSMMHPLEIMGLSDKSLNSHISGRLKQMFRSNDVIKSIEFPLPVSHLRKFSPFLWSSPRTNIPAMIAQHYLFALNRVFDDGVEFLVILEDDVIPEEDFLNFMNQLAPFLVDPKQKAFCISTWNDFGYSHFVNSNKKVFRTQYFPGLGWMIHKSFWFEIRDRFPIISWDWWMLAPSTNIGRDCLVPAQSRNHNIGKDEATNPDVFDSWLGVVHSTNDLVDLGDLSYLEIDNYEANQLDRVKRAILLSPNFAEFDADKLSAGIYLIPYESEYLWDVFTSLGLDSRYEPNTHHNHLIELQLKKHTILLADIRRCPYLKERDDFIPIDDTHIQPVQASPEETCTDACKRYKLTCDGKRFDVVNDCKLLSEVFGCTECHPNQMTGYTSVAPIGDLGESKYFKNYCLIISNWIDQFDRCEQKTARAFPARRLCPCSSLKK